MPREKVQPIIWEYKWAHWTEDINNLALEHWEPCIATWHERGAIFEFKSGRGGSELFEAHVVTLMRRLT